MQTLGAKNGNMKLPPQSENHQIKRKKPSLPKLCLLPATLLAA